MRDCSGDCALRRASAGAADPSRREFVNGALLASVGAFLAACGDGNIGGLTGTSGTDGPPLPGGGNLVVTIADFPALATDGGIARVDGGSSTPVAVLRVNATSHLAFSMICPHAGYRPIEIVASGFECPNHGARFNVAGGWTGGQRTRDLYRYAVVFTGGPGGGSLTISPLVAG